MVSPIITYLKSPLILSGHSHSQEQTSLFSYMPLCGIRPSVCL